MGLEVAESEYITFSSPLPQPQLVLRYIGIVAAVDLLGQKQGVLDWNVIFFAVEKGTLYSAKLTDLTIRRSLLDVREFASRQELVLFSLRFDPPL